jgi:hypothetical protein
VLRRLKPFDVKLHYTDRHRLSEEVERVLGLTFHPDAASMVPVCDVVTINAPLHPETEHLFNDELIGQMKRGAYLVNTARGKICDRDAIVRALESGQLAGYAGDVWFPQPAPKDHPWRTMPHHGMTPHVSGSSLSAQARYAAGVREILECWFENRPIREEYLIVDGGKLAGRPVRTPTVPATLPAVQTRRCASSHDLNRSTSHGSSVPGDDEPYLRWLAGRGPFGKQWSAGGDGGEAAWGGQRSGDVGGCGVIGRAAGSAGAAQVPRPAARPVWPPQEGYPLVGKGRRPPGSFGCAVGPRGRWWRVFRVPGGPRKITFVASRRKSSWARCAWSGASPRTGRRGRSRPWGLHLGEAGPLHSGIPAVGLRRPSKAPTRPDIERVGRTAMIEGRRLREPDHNAGEG